MIWKQIDQDQLYVFHNGVLIYKRWLKTGQSCLFDRPPQHNGQLLYGEKDPSFVRRIRWMGHQLRS